MTTQADTTRITVHRIDDLDPGQWLAGLREAELEQVPGSTIRNAIWCGLPFVVVGTELTIKHQLARLSPIEKCILVDCDYCWFLSDADEDPEIHSIQGIPTDRAVVLNHNTANQIEISSRVSEIRRYPNLVGLSSRSAYLRSEIARIAAGPQGPSSSVLILGESGAGKEEVAKALFLSSDRGRGQCPNEYGEFEGFGEIACGWFVDTLIQSQLFGTRIGAATDITEGPGLLQRYSAGVLLIDDFDVAPLSTQAALLRIMSTPMGKAAPIMRVGEVSPSEATNVWLLFSTNASVEQHIADGEMREDFLFRFEDRVIHIPPLRERPGDWPALAHFIWAGIWQRRGRKLNRFYRPLLPIVLNDLFSKEIGWKGNVRAMRTLFSLAANIVCNPRHNNTPLRQVFDLILDRGPDFHHWIKVISRPEYSKSAVVVNPQIAAILDLDSDKQCRGKSTKRSTQTESKAWSCLTQEGKNRLEKVFEENRKQIRDQERKIRTTVGVARIILYVAATDEIVVEQASQLTELTENSAKVRLTWLEKAGILETSAPKAGVKQRWLKSTLFDDAG